MSRVHPVIPLALLGLLAAVYILRIDRSAPADTSTFRVRVQIVDERGDPVRGAVLRLPTRAVTAADGTAVVDTDQPVAGVVRAAGYLAEPVVLSRNVAPVLRLRLWAARSPGGTPRISLHVAGDAMLGRRYVWPARKDTTHLAAGDGGASARRIVSDLAPLFSAASISTVNLETVVGALPTRRAYSAKRFLLQTPPTALAALQELGVDAVTLGNNHANDWEDRGVAATRRSLDAAGIPYTGAGETDKEARAPLVLGRSGQRVALLSYTTVTGDFVNDNLPTRETPRPAGLPRGEEWQYTARPFGFGRSGSRPYLREDTYRAGDAWQWFRGLEDLSPRVETALWKALRAVYPELQDWVARRGHAGAAAFSQAKVRADVAAVRRQGVDLVIVQIHGGFQFSEVASVFFRRAAHASVDAGADLVVGHHPHVVQGFEWYKGRLVMHSLGNVLFDQDFLSTFPSVFVRTVFEGDQLLEARAYPLMLDRYRPVPVAGEVAARIVRELRSDSDLTAPAARTTGGIVARVTDSVGDERGVEQADLRLEGNAAVLQRPREGTPRTLRVAEDGVAEIPLPAVIRPDALAPGTSVGLDLLRFGNPDDTTANRLADGAMNWDLLAAQRTEVTAVDRATGDLAFRLQGRELRGASLRPIARIERKTHRFRTLAGEAADGRATYTVRLRVRNAGTTTAFIRFDVYRFDDSNPLRDPESELLRRVPIPVSLPSDDRWHTISVPVPARVFRAVRGKIVNSAMLYLGLEQGRRRDVLFDRVQLLEWRRADGFPERLWLEADALSPPAVADTVTALVR